MKNSAKKQVFVRQLSFLPKNSLKSEFGGASKIGNPKVARPVSTKHFMHLVLKSERARGAYSFLRYEREIKFLAQKLSVRFGVEIKDIVVMGNHIHIALKSRMRSHASFRLALSSYLRSLSGLIARKMLRAEKGRASKLDKFFLGRPFSRIVDSGMKSLKILWNYFELNRLEKIGICKQSARIQDQLFIFAASG